MVTGPDRPSASMRVHVALRAAILGGTLAPDDKVPSERALAEEHGVNRHAVREALKRLEQAGLVRIAQGGATRVEDWRRTGGLELLLDLLGPDGDRPPLELVRGVLELRAAIGADAALACAARGTDAARATVAERATACAAAIDAGAGSRAVDAAHEATWDAVVDGAGNVAYRLALTSLVRALGASPELQALVRPRQGDGLRRLGAAIAAQEPGEAATVARTLLAADVVALDATGWTS